MNTYVLPELLGKQNQTEISGSLCYLTPWKLVGNLTLGPENNPAITVPRFLLKYTPQGLAQGLVDSIILDGATVKLSFTNGKLSLAGFPHTATGAKSTREQRLVPTFPFMSNNLEFRNLHIIIEKPNSQKIALITQAQITPDFTLDTDQRYEINGVDTKLESSGALSLSIESRILLKKDHSTIEFNVNITELRQLLVLLSSEMSSGAIQGHGNAILTGKARLSENFSIIEDLTADLQTSKLIISYPPFSLISDEEQPLQAQVKGSGNNLHFEVSHIDITGPQNVQAALRGTILPDSGRITGTGDVNTELLSEEIQLQFEGRTRPEGLSIKVKASGPKQQLDLVPNMLFAGPYSLNLSAEKKNDYFDISSWMEISSLMVPQYQIQANDIALKLAYTIHNHSVITNNSGIFSIGTIDYREEDIAELSGHLETNPNGIAFQGAVETHLASPLKINFDGSSSTERPLFLEFNLPPSTVDIYSVPSFVPLPADLDFSGTVQLHGQMSIENNTPQGSVQFALDKGEFTLEEQDISAKSISTTIIFPDFPQIISNSSQQLHIGTIDIGNIKLSDGSIYYRIEDPNTLFIEKSRFGWCGGKVESGSLRVNTIQPILSTTLYCDRLQFAELLRQFGISDTDGNGSLNGRLPIHFTADEMVFDDGFLFSTPGNNGIVRFNNTEMLRQGMPEMGQAAYLEYSLQAMENFSYNWTKLTFNTEGEDLLVKMQIDGKPESPLPYGYRSGQLIHDEQGTGIQHPIRLDVNFHLPFAQMFKYGQNLQKIMENM